MNATFARISAALQAVLRCPSCGKLTTIANTARRGFTAEPVTVETHCACAPNGPALHLAPAPAAATTEICSHCGESRERAVFYGSDCREEGEWIMGAYFPGPTRGDHSFVTVLADTSAPTLRIV